MRLNTAEIQKKTIKTPLTRVKLKTPIIRCFFIAIMQTILYNQIGDFMTNVIQFGEGNFLRAFVDYYFQLAQDKGDFNGSITICQPRKNTKIINALKNQNCKYNVLLRGKLNGRVVNDVKQINCVKEAVDTVGEYDKLIACFLDTDLKILVSNTTESGIVFNPADRLEGAPDVSFPAKVTALLYERYKSNLCGLVFLPVELIENNGDELKNCIIKYAELWELGSGFIAYINNDCDFCNTLVDRIVTGYAEYENDLCAVACEPYGSFIIEASQRARDILPFDNISDIKYVDSIIPYRERKVKILNGAHTSSVLTAYDMGITIVRDMMNDSVAYRFINDTLKYEIIPTIDLDEKELSLFASTVLERFDNPFIDHKLLDISLNSVAKFKTRCLPSILDYYDKYGKLPKRLCFSLAGLINFYKKGYGNDSECVMEFFKNAKCTVSDVLQNTDFWGMDLTEIDGMYDMVNNYYGKIQTLGAKKAMEYVCNE